MTERITITPRVVDAQEVASIVSLVQLGRVPEAWDRFQDASVGDGALARLGGVINAALAAKPPADRMQWLVIPWGDGKRYEVPNLADQTLVVRIDVPADTPVSSQAGQASVFEFRGEPWLREICLSRYPGDFESPAASGGMLASVIFRVGATENIGYAGMSDLLAGGTYYVNIRNYIRDAGAKPAAVEIRWPR